MNYIHLLIIIFTAFVIGMMFGHEMGVRHERKNRKPKLVEPSKPLPIGPLSGIATVPEDIIYANLREAREAASHDNAEPMYSHRGWRNMLRAALYYVDRYDQLLYQVAQKFPGESRYETALRYLRERETPSSNIGCATTNALMDNAAMTARK